MMGSGASGLLNDLAANDKTVHSDFYNQENFIILILVFDNREVVFC